MTTADANKLPMQKRFEPTRFRKQDKATGEWSDWQTLNIDPQVYTSVHNWKPVQPERFMWLLHAYQMEELATDEHGHSKMSATVRHLSRGVTSVIYYLPNSVGSTVSSPVLMSLSYESGKVICFASLMYGREAEAN